MNTWTDRFAERMARVRASEIRELLKLLDQPDILSFAGGIPDPQLFPAERLQAAYQQVLTEAGAQALQYSVSEGLPELRRWIAARMTADGVPCDEGNIVITAGSQQALDLIGKLFLTRGDTVLAERPTYLARLARSTPMSRPMATWRLASRPARAWPIWSRTSPIHRAAR